MQIQGTYSKTLYTDDNGIGTFIVNLADGGYYQCVGESPLCYPGTPLTLNGSLSKDGTFYIEEAKMQSIDTKILAEFLSSGIFEGIGPTLALKIVEALNGEDLFEYIKKNGSLPHVKGLSETRASLVIEKLAGTENMRDFISFCILHGLTFTQAHRIYLRFGELSEQTVRTVPFKLIKDNLLTYEQADHFAYENGLSHEDPDRVHALIFHSMFSAYNMGHVYVTLKGLSDCIRSLETKSPYQKNVSGCVILLTLYDIVAKNQLIWEEKDGMTRIYLKSTYEAEKTAAREIKRLNTHENTVSLFKADILDKIEEEFNFRYDPMQRQAFGVFHTPGIKIVTGGPGTGKTTIIKGMIRFIESIGKSYVLCAPTGRAAQRMTEVCGHNASTIHKLLDIRPYGKDEYICRGKENPITADFVIVDEMSMVGIELFAKLVNAIKTGATLILVGDIDQLASVTPGKVLKDLIDAGIETYALNVVFRQKGLSSIVKNAAIINRKSKFLIEDDNFIIRRYDKDSLSEMAEDAVKLFKESYDENDLFKCEIIAPIKKGDAGVFHLNSLAQKAVNPGLGSGIKKGDRVIFTVNNYEENYFNGDIGIIENIDKDSFSVRLSDKTLTLPHSCLQDVSLAYGITSHRSQGSEYNEVIIVLPKCGLLAKNLIYTSVTRSRNKVYIFSEEDALETSIFRDWTLKRNSALTERLLNKSA